MEIGVTVFVITILIAAIWIVIEIKRMKHKLFAIFLIGLILFAYLSFTFVLKGEDMNYKTFEGAKKASQIYFSWLGSVGGNMKSITNYAIKQDWSKENSSSGNTSDSKSLKR